MDYIQDIELLKKRVQTPQGQALVNKMQSDVEWFDHNFRDDPKVLSGWGHQYFCNQDGAFLCFDLESPDKHVCPVCGEAFTSENYHSAWVYMYRYQAMMSAFEAAVLYRLTQDNQYVQHFKRIVGFYSDHYSEFEEHGKGPTTSGNGKITPQALNEAIFLVRAVNGLELLKDVLEKDFIESVSNHFLIPGALFVNAQKKIIHNIPCWINAAVGTVGLFTQDALLISKAFDAPLGLYDQIRQGVTKDFFWYEGSIHYNCFTLESFINLLFFAKLYKKAVPQDILDTVYQMILAPCRMSFSNGILPNPNDGWPNLNLKTYSYLFEMASSIFHCDEIQNILANIYAQKNPRTTLPMSSPIYKDDYCIEWLLFSKLPYKDAFDLWTKSYNFESSNYAILRKKNTEVFIKYGHCSPSHAHPDKMNIEVMAFNQLISRDLSNCGYAARLCKEYHRTSVSHNTVVVDGQSHPTTEKGICRKFDSKDGAIEVSYCDAYKDVDFCRNISVQDHGFADVFTVTAPQGKTLDWFFHVEGKLLSSVSSETAELGFSENGYQHLKDIRRVLTDKKEITLKWKFGSQVTGTQTLSLDEIELFICKSYDNPVNQFRTTIILRSKSKEASFRQYWQFQAE